MRGLPTNLGENHEGKVRGFLKEIILWLDDVGHDIIALNIFLYTHRGRDIIKFNISLVRVVSPLFCPVLFANLSVTASTLRHNAMLAKWDREVEETFISILLISDGFSEIANNNYRINDWDINTPNGKSIYLPICDGWTKYLNSKLFHTHTTGWCLTSQVLLDFCRA